MWTCPECGCQGIAAGLFSCPQCYSARDVCPGDVPSQPQVTGTYFQAAPGTLNVAAMASTLQQPPEAAQDAPEPPSAEPAQAQPLPSEGGQ